MTRAKASGLQHAPARPLDLVLAYAAMHVPDGAWTPVPIDDADPTTPWLKPRTVLMAHIPHVGFVAIAWSDYSLRAVLHDTCTHAPDIVTRRLVYTKGGAAVVLRDEQDAINRLTDVVTASGALPPLWRWDPPMDFSRDGWKPRRLELHEVIRGVEAFQWQGSAANWSIESASLGYVIKRNGRVVRDPLGRRFHSFPTLAAAKAYCEQRDHQR